MDEMSKTSKDLMSGPAPSSKRKSKKKKKKSKNATVSSQDSPSAGQGGSSTSLSTPSASQQPPQLPPSTGKSNHRSANAAREKIWNTSSQEERERIKDFWLSLGEEDRRSLVKVEKEAVLRKMKEQQKHSCSCTVCGRKRTAIEEELEVLYDAYYEELEQYANHQQSRLEDGIPVIPQSRRFGPLAGLQPPHRLPPSFNPRQPSRGKIEELPDDEGDEPEYSDEYEYSDEESEPRHVAGHASDFFNFGSSLTVQGMLHCGISASFNDPANFQSRWHFDRSG
jgi:hypothetical protein